MKHNLQDIKIVRYIGIALLVLTLALISSRSAAATPPPEDPIGNTQESQKAISSYLAAQNNLALSDEEKIKAAISAYFVLRYEGQQSLVVPYINFVDAPPSHWAWQNIERLYNAGITAGCQTNPLKYCPESSVTRAQMAIFLLRGKYGSTYTPPAATHIFEDVTEGSYEEPFIEKLYDLGIMAGCQATPLKYCPANNTTHAQMAIFLLRSKYGGGYTPPEVGDSTGFYDVPTSHSAAAWIKQAAAEGIFDLQELISDGCTPGNFCPGAHVTRALMAGLLVRTFNLP